MMKPKRTAYRITAIVDESRKERSPNLKNGVRWPAQVSLTRRSETAEREMRKSLSLSPFHQGGQGACMAVAVHAGQ